LLQINYNGGWSDYHALQVKLEKHCSRGLYLLNSFAWSKTTDNTSGHMEPAMETTRASAVSTCAAQRPFRLRPAFNDTNGHLELPFGRHRHFGANVSRRSTLRSADGSFRDRL
jgi:hypothetical protein